MSAVLLAVFEDFEAAERIRVELVRDGFPTDRVELTASCSPGRAGLEPAGTFHDKLCQYFETLFTLQEERHYAHVLAEHVESGAATVTVLPRGRIEIDRATEILHHAAPREVAEHDLGNQRLEHAAARKERPWIGNFWVEGMAESHCLYCWLFERNPE
jgi:hypothetical protein